MQKGTGNGGQKINKTSSAVRLRHRPTGIAVAANEERSQARNRHIALRKLRFEIAMRVHADPSGSDFTPLPSPSPFDEDEALRRFERPEIDIDVDLGAGEASTLLWTCDFSHEYVTINGDYRT